ncbi:hypothetical protein JOD82_001813 [Paenibacillus sp. 1182]|uniref:hypothetical protein n=1 Tax=Paenibacillus sp. 1182 TaxID=2806565 RepID=UPI001AE1A496|nr:hypothetical protein [Paenibacillus sp. 1182]MBP1308793.1 hypothetical protein [Paenibacillus sp. 1182]
MSNPLILVTEPDTGLEWLYVNGIQVTSGEPIYAEQWMSVLQKYKVFDRVSSVERTEGFVNASTMIMVMCQHITIVFKKEI